MARNKAVEAWLDVATDNADGCLSGTGHAEKGQTWVGPLGSHTTSDGRLEQVTARIFHDSYQSEGRKPHSIDTRAAQRVCHCLAPPSEILTGEPQLHPQDILVAISYGGLGEYEVQDEETGEEGFLDPHQDVF